MSRALVQATALAACLALSACGGSGGGGGGGVGSTPVPSPPPPPPPGGLSAMSVSIFPDVNASATFDSLGIELNGSSVTSTGFTVSYDKASGNYVFDLPGQPAGAFKAGSNSTSTFWDGGPVVSQGASSIFWPPMSVLKPRPDNPLIQLSYTSFAAYKQAGPMEDVPHGYVAFGLATPAAGIPTAGTATMTGIATGHTASALDIIGGQTNLQFNFSNGTLAGWFDPIHYDYYGIATPLGRYSFANTVYGVGSNAFSGKLNHSDQSLTGAFNGLLTGPNAEEMMARWSATYRLPGSNAQPDTMVGIWVGKRTGN